MTKYEMQRFRELFNKFCRGEINNGKCEASDVCECCSVNQAYNEIFNNPENEMDEEYDDD